MYRRTITRIGLVCSMLLCIMLSFGLESAYAADKIVMKLAHPDPMDVFTSRKHAALMTFKEMVETNSGGRIEVVVLGGGAVGGEREILESILNGTLQGSSISAPVGLVYPPQMVISIPYLFASAPAAWEVLDGPFGDKLATGLLKKTGLRCLGFTELGFKQFTNNKRPIRTPEDAKGLKIRVLENPLYMQFIKLLGANPTPLPWPEVYMALQTGVVDGQENPVSVVLMQKLQEVQKYCTMDGHIYGEEWFIVNDKYYQRLPKDLQGIVAGAARVAVTVQRGTSQLFSSNGIATLKKAGMQFYVPTPKEKELFIKATQGPIVQWLKTKVDPKLVDEVLQAAAKANKKHPY